jgi:arylformamidase
LEINKYSPPKHLIGEITEMRYRYLSYAFKSEIPVYGGRAFIHADSVKSLANGDSANTFLFSIENHWGTHIDGPNHFYENGLKIINYPPEFWFFESPQVIQINLRSSELLNLDGWTKDMDAKSDLLLFQSGWNKLREEKVYVEENPGINPDVALYLRKHFPNIKTIGIDWISISPYKNKIMGREAHRAFLDPEGENDPILIIEDMDLSYRLDKLKKVMAFPILMETIDSAPCTVIGEFND